MSRRGAPPPGQPGLPIGDEAVTSALRPLADRMRPTSLDDLVGQSHVAGAGTPLRAALESGKPYSMILWGPPGCGKTTLALLVARYAEAEFIAISAVLGGIAEVRAATARAAANFEQGRRTVLFVDEVHRFNKAQQDAFLPHVERGTLVFVGATTENPSFELNSALLSRCRVHVLKAVTAADMVPALRRALVDPERGLGDRPWQVDDATLAQIADVADGDVRRALTVLEIAAELSGDADHFDEALLQQVLADRGRRFDKGGEQFYDQISALHKSVRSSDPDAAVYWLARMLDGGADPGYVARRLLRMASEDIGLADPRALDLALNAWNSYDRLGSPEGELMLAQCAIYLAVAPKSNAAYMAWNQALADVRSQGTLEVPVHLRNAPTRLMKQLGYGRDYQYDHDVEGGVALDQQCLPDALAGTRYYEPVARGLEIQIRDKLGALRAARDKARR
ncbi:replication-associated recombination protein A [Pseudofulvimonas gallinarii]|jgi:putative ATPase|uniref:Replication-associated recombination protein A n=1 Tax=Pseudofulvimonas gallinarii TaxID=634155 RepID=A0A4S3KU99_9GAMM|nr:recombination protein MgsA [Pseudofulvimonas gallinarii]THD12783.1 recombination factor protein RarA [Pseudofulvimonas gallinarii]